MINKFDYLVIGGGSGGIASGRWVAKNFNKKVCVIEHKKLGGTCVNVGCVPKKTMWNAASMLDDIRHTGESFGVETKDLNFDWKTHKKNRDEYIKRLNKIYGDMLTSNNMTYLKGYGKFIDEKTVECEGNLYSADHILIATGSTPVMADIEGIEHAISSDGFFDLEEQPKRVAVLGGGYIGIEIGQIFHSLGTKVVHLVRDSLLTFLDGEVRETLLRNMNYHQYDLRQKSTINKIEKLPSSELRITVKNIETNQEYSEVVDQVLVATGRRANTDLLSLQNTSLKLNNDGSIWVDEYENTSVKGIYAIGDVTSKLMLTPVAVRCGRILGERLFGGKAQIKMDYQQIPTVIFSHPPIGVIGLSEEDATKKYGKENIKVYRSEFNNMFFSLIEDRSKRELSLFKIICLKSDDERVLGIHAHGRGVDEMMQGLGVAIKMGAKKRDLDRCVAIHPTASEEFVTADPKYDE